MLSFKNISVLLFGLVEWGIFLILIMYKLFLFATLTETVFYSEGAFGFIKNIFLFLFYGQSFNYLRHDLVLVSFGFLTLSTFWILLFKRRIRIILLTIANGLLTLLIYADLIHYRYFGDFTSFAELTQLNQVRDVSDSIISLMEWKDLLFWIDLLIILPIVIFVLKKVTFPNADRKIFSALIFLFIGWFSLAQGMFQFYFDHGGKGIVDKMISDVTVYNHVGLLGYHYFDARRFFKDLYVSKKGISSKQKEQIIEFFRDKEPKINKETFGLMNGKNLIVVQVEALQDFVIGRKVSGIEITPFLNRLKEESMYFQNFFHQAGQGRTSDADFLANASLYPLSSGSVFVRFPSHSFQTMAKVLRENGYHTSVHHAFEAGFWNRNIVYPQWGYGDFYSKEDFQEGENIGWGLEDKEFLIQSVEQIPEAPFYSFLITLTSHHPYTMPEKHHKLNVNGINDALLRDYLQSIHYVDRALEEFVSVLKRKGLWDNSIVVFYGDHDAGILNEGEESGLFATEGSQNHIDFLLEKNKVPLFIHLPGNALAGTYDTYGGQVDLAPTLLHLLGVSTEEFYYIGEDLLFSENRHPVVFAGQEMTDGHVWYTPGDDSDFYKGKCYDIQSKQQVSVEACYTVYKQGVAETEISQNIIIGNWIGNRK